MADIQYVNIKDIRPGLKNINVMFIVLEMGKPTRTKDGHDVRSCKVADKSGSINVSIWDEAGDLLQSGDICRLTKGYASLWKGCLTVYTGKNGIIAKIGEFCLQFSELPNMSEANPDFLAKNDQPPQQRKSPTESDGSQTMMPSQTPGNRPQMSGGPPQMGGQGGNGQYRGPRPQHSGPRGPPPINGRGRGMRR
ncbi:SOSS complex subunit B2-like [Haliotis cracherodii]|uniref:SOSS complex subunit B2-like n=1 Tax=Haliotis rufescens TaxID=6454 RepID=UPI001EB09A0C|nr:SOSS complex subunit B2-like [Haliotis rufescens]